MNRKMTAFISGADCARLLRAVAVLAIAIVTLGMPPAYAYDQPASGVRQTEPKKIACIAPAPKTPVCCEGDAELKDRVKELEARELEGLRKQIDWWLTALAIFAAVGGFAIPYLVVRKDKESIEQDKKSINEAKEFIKIDTERIAQNRKGIEEDREQVRTWLDEIERLKHKASEDSAAIHKKLEIVSGSPEAVSEDVQQTARKTAEDSNADPLLRLRAKAVEASRPNNAQEAYTLWNTLAEFDTQDANAQFNAGYWAGELANNAQGADKLYWLGIAGKYYSQALNTASDMHEAAYNWGIVLATEASVLSATELVAARARWKLAGEKYQLALCIKPSFYEASNNWGAALDAEARVLAATELGAARALWKQAGEKYQQALSINPKDYEIAFNWGESLDAEASALATIEPDVARVLWSQAGEKFQLALKIKPDDYDSIDSLGGVLIAEASIIVASDAEGSRKLLDQAEQLLLAHADAAPGRVAYNLACVYGLRGDVLSCLKWLKICQSHQKLESCEYMRKDKDLDAVRNDPAFVEWFKQVCP